jgi:hypothetical protein
LPGNVGVIVFALGGLVAVGGRGWRRRAGRENRYVHRALLEVDFLLVVVDPQSRQQVQALGDRPVELAEYCGAESVELRGDLAALSREVVVDHGPTRAPERDVGVAVGPR